MTAPISVTGSSGFIARHLIPALRNAGHYVRGLDTQVCPTEFGDKVELILGDVRDQAAVERLLDGAGSVIHLAAEHQDFGVSEAQFHDVNVRGMDVILSACRKLGVTDFVFFSSVAVYGEQGTATHEMLAPSPNSPDGASKLKAEELLNEWVDEAGERRGLIIRPTVVYGEYNYANMYRLIRAITGRRYVQIGSGENRKSIAYVGNVVAAALHLMATRPSGSEAFNVADVPAMTSRQIAERIADSSGTSLPRLHIPLGVALPLAMPLDWIARITGLNIPITSKRISKFLAPTEHLASRLGEAGFEPPFSQAEGIERTVRWVAEETS